MEVYQRKTRNIPDSENNKVFWSELDASSFPTKLLYNTDDLMRSVQHLLTTVPGERFFNPTFGSPAFATLFDLTDESTLRSNFDWILKTIENQEPRIQVDKKSSKLIADRNSGRLELTLVYNITGDTSYTKYTYTLNL